MSRVHGAFQAPSRRSQALTASARPEVASVARPGTTWLGSGLPRSGRAELRRLGRAAYLRWILFCTHAKYCPAHPGARQARIVSARPGRLGSARQGRVPRPGQARDSALLVYAEPSRRGSGVATYSLHLSTVATLLHRSKKLRHRTTSKSCDTELTAPIMD